MVCWSPLHPRRIVRIRGVQIRTPHGRAGRGGRIGGGSRPADVFGTVGLDVGTRRVAVAVAGDAVEAVRVQVCVAG